MSQPHEGWHQVAWRGVAEGGREMGARGTEGFVCIVAGVPPVTGVSCVLNTVLYRQQRAAKGAPPGRQHALHALCFLVVLVRLHCRRLHADRCQASWRT